jgi:hypothetical protein
MTLWGYNHYDVHPDRIWDWYDGSLAGLQANGAEERTVIEYTRGSGRRSGPIVNLPPAANEQTVQIPTNGSLLISLSGRDPNGDSITYAIGQRPKHGTLSRFHRGLGTVTYTPNPGFAGEDSFQFTIGDFEAASEPATVRLIVGSRKRNR